MSSSIEPALVSLNPPDVLTFQLERDTAPKAILSVTNTSANRIVFKVKTTQPSWYYVRPNQQVVEVGQTEEVTIVLIDSECSRFLERASSERADTLNKHRFLVQSKVIDDEDYVKILSITPPQQRTEEYTRIWGTGQKDERKNLKLKVDFLYLSEVQTLQLQPTNNSQNNQQNNTQINTQNNTQNNTQSASRTSVSENVETIRNRISKHRATEQPVEDSEPLNPLDDLQNLKKKYEDVVEYTVHLTAQRDANISRLREIESELGKESKRKKNGSSPRNGNKGEMVDKKALKGYSLVVLLLAGLLSFIAGRFSPY